MVTRALFLPILCFFVTFAYGQNYTSSYEPLSVGDKVPNLTLKLLNYKSETARLSDFQGKLLILDFWNTSCGACIASWPKLLSLQEKFSDKIQIILVNPRQNADVVTQVVEKRRRLAGVNMDLPLVCGDTVIRHLLPYNSVPHIAWIDQRGYLRAVTTNEYVNEKTISDILQRRPVAMRQKSYGGDWEKTIQEETGIVDLARKPLFVNGNGTSGKFMPLITQSVLTGKIQGQTPFYSHHADSSFSMLVLVNTSIEVMYRIAYNDSNFESGSRQELDYLNSNRVVWKVDDWRLKARRESGEVDDSYIYSYHLTTRPTSKRRLQHILQADLEKYFGLSAQLTMMKVPCLILLATDTSKMRYNGRMKYPILNQETDRTVWYNRTVAQLVWRLTNDQYYASPFPIVDETGYSGRVGGFEIYDDYVQFDKELQRYGMRICLEEREIPVLVVSDNDSYEFPRDLERTNDVGLVAWSYD